MLGPGVNGIFVETCSDIIAVVPFEPCECGKMRQRGSPHGWRLPGAVLIGRVAGVAEADGEQVLPDHYRIEI